MEGSSKKRLVLSILNLGIQFFIHIGKRLFLWKKQGLKPSDKFIQQFKKDYIVPFNYYDRLFHILLSRCINCGICQSQCPITDLCGGNKFPGPNEIASSLSRPLDELWSARDAIYYCMQCSNCEVVCPQGVPIAEMVAFVRRFIEKQDLASVPEGIKDEKITVQRFDNIFPVEKRYFDEFEKEKAEYAVFCGCISLSKLRDTTESTLKLLIKIGIDFTTFKEKCCRFRQGLSLQTNTETIEENIDLIKRKRCQKIIALCPECAFVLKNHLQDKIEVLPLFMLLNSYNLDKKVKEVVTYHDSCYLGRRLGYYDEPREVIKAFCSDFVELKNRREYSKCCGSGGQLDRISEEISRKMAQMRLEEARASGANILIAECPHCLYQLRRNNQNNGLQILSIAELLASRGDL